MNSGKGLYSLLAYLVVALFALFPLFFSLPFRIHLDLPYEGAYRLYQGQVPFRDFTMPLSYGFLIIPTLCFYIFGPYLKSLLIAQAIITVIGGVSFISILNSLKFSKVNIFISVLVFCLSYTFIYFWPWYNNTAFTFQLAGINLILKSLQTNKFKSYLLLVPGTLFIFLTFFTKQDYGGLAFIFGFALTLYAGIIQKRYYLPLIYGGIYACFAFALIVPLLKYDFLHWFNLGQPPHQNRLKFFDILNELFLNSEWEKFYLLAIIVLLLNTKAKIKEFFYNQNDTLLLLISVGFIAEALITKITSNQSTGNTTFYHGFAIAFILYFLNLKFDLAKPINLIPVLLFIIIWWSGMYWKYASQILKIQSDKIADFKDTGPPKKAINWELSEFKSFEKVKLPTETIEGIRRLKTNTKPDSKVLNLTELTMLAHELKYTPLLNLPLWYHLNIGIFQSQVDTICKKITAKEYDLVLFEEIPSLDNFFPEQIRIALQQNYHLKDNFIAPRKEGDSFIEVYVP